MNKIGDAAAAAMIAKTKNSPIFSRPHLIRGLGWCDTWRIREGVLPYFDDPNPAMRHAAVASLYNTNDPRVTGALLRSLRDSAVEVRKEAISHFKGWPTAAAFDPLASLLNDVDPEVREEAVGAISQLKSPRLVPVLVAVLQKPGEVDDVRYRAAFYLGLSGDQRAVEPLLAVLNDLSFAAHVRASAAEGLARLHAVRAIAPLIEVLKQRDQPTELRTSAAHALTDFKDPRAAEQLLEAARTENNSDLRFWGAMGVATIAGGAVCDDRIVTALRDYSYRVDGRDRYYGRKQLVLRMIVENGKTESIRSAAIAADPLWPRRYDSLWGR
ncbi:MAG: HEAT repeat domain-containing protein [Planctomycetes bacterium]|nr:HEAT repeat domain-containing protein [Planctomycetota bacterium]